MKTHVRTAKPTCFGTAEALIDALAKQEFDVVRNTELPGEPEGYLIKNIGWPTDDKGELRMDGASSLMLFGLMHGLRTDPDIDAKLITDETGMTRVWVSKFDRVAMGFNAAKASLRELTKELKEQSNPMLDKRRDDTLIDGYWVGPVRQDSKEFLPDIVEMMLDFHAKPYFLHQGIHMDDGQVKFYLSFDKQGMNDLLNLENLSSLKSGGKGIAGQ